MCDFIRMILEESFINYSASKIINKKKIGVMSEILIVYTVFMFVFNFTTKTQLNTKIQPNKKQFKKRHEYNKKTVVDGKSCVCLCVYALLSTSQLFTKHCKNMYK